MLISLFHTTTNNNQSTMISNNTGSVNEDDETIKRKEREEWLRSILDPVLPSTIRLDDGTYYTASSPQTQAFQWLQDPSTSNTRLDEFKDESMIRERYILAVFGFAMSSSMSSNKIPHDWTQEVPFLTTGHVCDWSTTFHTTGKNGFEGVTCNSEGYVTKLIFCK